jgi:hypothetical protein
MTPVARAVIEWLRPEDGGRSTLPAKGRYATIAKFSGQERWPEEAWTLVAELAEPPDYSRRSVATIHFLADEAPHHLLARGNRFELFEGRRVVARGEVVEEVVQLSASTGDSSTGGRG